MPTASGTEALRRTKELNALSRCSVCLFGVRLEYDDAILNFKVRTNGKSRMRTWDVMEDCYLVPTTCFIYRTKDILYSVRSFIDCFYA